MPEVKILIEGSYDKLSGKGSRSLNKLLDTVTNIVVTEIGEDIEKKAKEYASGIDKPEDKVINQAPHPIGKSESGYSPSGELERGIFLFSFGKGKVEVVSKSEKSSWLEFGTGLFGPLKQKIRPTRKEALKFTTPNFGAQVVASVKGQRPQPFMRGAAWYTIDNIKPTLGRIQNILRKYYG